MTRMIEKNGIQVLESYNGRAPSDLIEYAGEYGMHSAVRLANDTENAATAVNWICKMRPPKGQGLARTQK